MALINYNDYFDFEGLDNAIKEADASNKQFGTSVEAVNKRIKQSYDEIGTELKQYLTTLQNFNVNQKNAATSIGALSKEIDDLKNKQKQQLELINNLTQANELATASVNDLSTAAKGIKKEFDATAGSTEKDILYKKQLADQYQRLTLEIKNQANALKVTKAAVDASEGSYQLLQQQLTSVGKQLKALPNAFDPVTGKLNTQNKEAVALSKRYGEINVALKSADAGMGNFQRNVGNYSNSIIAVGQKAFSFLRQAAFILPGLGLSGEFLLIFEGLKAILNALDLFPPKIHIVDQTIQGTDDSAQNLRDSLKELGDNAEDIADGAFKKLDEATKQLETSLGETPDAVDVAQGALVLLQDELDKTTKKFDEVSNKSISPFGFAPGATEAAQEKQLSDQIDKIGKKIDEGNAKITKQRIEQEKTDAVEIGKVRAKELQDLAQLDIDANQKIIANDQKDFNVRTAALKENLDKQFFIIFTAHQLELNEAKGSNGKIAAADEKFRIANLKAQADYSEKLFDLNKKQSDLSFNDQKALLQFEIEKQKAIIENDKLLYIFRNEAAQKSHDFVNQLTDLELQHRKISAVEARIAIEKNEIELNKNLEKIFLDRVKRESDAAIEPPETDEAILERQKAAHKKFVDDLTKQVQDGGRAIQTQEAINQLDELAALDDKHNQGLIKESKYQQEKLEIQKKYNALRIQTQIQELQAELSLVDPNSNRAAELIKQIKELQAQLKGLAVTAKDLSPIFDSFYKNLEALANISGNAVASFFNDLTHTIQDLAESGTASLQDYAQTAISLGYAVTDELNQASEKRIAQLEKDKGRELTLAGNNAAAQQAINERYQKEEARLKRKEAVNNKINALFQIAINTAVAVSKAASSVAGIPLIPFLIGLGAAEAAVVLAQPLPQFEKGTQHAPEGYAVVDEKGTELIVDRHGRLKEVGSNSGARITHLDEGDKVFTAAKTKEVFRQIEEGKIMREMQLNARLTSTINEGKRAQAVDIMTEAFKSAGVNNGNIAAAFRDAVKDIPVHQTIIDENGVHERLKRKDSLTTFRNTYNFGHKRNKN